MCVCVCVYIFEWCFQASALTSEDVGLVHPGLLLKYSIHKNLASMAAQRNEYNKAMENYLEVGFLLLNANWTDFLSKRKICIKLSHGMLFLRGDKLKDVVNEIVLEFH